MSKKKRNLFERIVNEGRRFARRQKSANEVASMRKLLAQDLASGSRIALRIRGGIGDHLITARFVRDLLAETGGFNFDIFTPRVPIAEWLFSDLPGFKISYYDRYLWRHASPCYPLSIEIDQLVLPQYDTADWLTITRRHPKLARICNLLEERFPAFEACAEYLPFLDGHLARIATFMGMRRADLMHKTCGIKYGGDHYPLKTSLDALTKYELNGKKFVTVSNGFDAEFNSRTTRATKVYPHMNQLTKLIKMAHPDIKIVQIGNSTSSPLDSADLNLINATTITEVTGLLDHAELHIDSEGGLVHIATAVGTKCCVLFGPTAPEYFGYDSNFNIAPNICGNCYWITRNWMDQCVKYEHPRCLFEQPPESVFETVRPYLAERMASDGQRSATLLQLHHAI